jgi:hypothetical protein
LIIWSWLVVVGVVITQEAVAALVVLELALGYRLLLELPTQ